MTLLGVARWLAGQRKPAAGRVPGAELSDDDGDKADQPLVLQELAEKVRKLKLANARTEGSLIPRAVLAELADRFAMAGAQCADRLEAVIRPHGESAVDAMNNALAELSRAVEQAAGEATDASNDGRFAVSATPADKAGPGRKSRGGRPRKGTR